MPQHLTPIFRKYDIAWTDHNNSAQNAVSHCVNYMNSNLRSSSFSTTLHRSFLRVVAAIPIRIPLSRSHSSLQPLFPALHSHHNMDHGSREQQCPCARPPQPTRDGHSGCREASVSAQDMKQMKSLTRCEILTSPSRNCHCDLGSCKNWWPRSSALRQIYRC
ncbi:hypothetical protein CC79DRAFT_544460 [Sarocladium strictum]